MQIYCDAVADARYGGNPDNFLGGEKKGELQSYDHCIDRKSLIEMQEQEKKKERIFKVQKKNIFFFLVERVLYYFF